MSYTLSLQTTTWEPVAISQSTRSVRAALTRTGGNLANITHVGREAKSLLKIRKVFLTSL